MRRLLTSVLLAASLAILVAVPAAAQSSIALDAVVRLNFSHGQTPPCVAREEGETTCFYVGRARSLGALTYEVTATFTEDRFVLVFSDGSTLTLMPDFDGATFTRPGNSTNAPGAMKSYGNPAQAQVPVSIVGGTGAFDGATGNLVEDWQIAGDIWVIRLTGVVLLS